MITVKQYAEDRNITIQAVHQSMKGKRKKGLLEGHVHLVDGIKWLDDEAVAILDTDRKKPPVIYERENANATIEQLRQDREMLLAKVTALSEWKAENAMAIAEANQTQLRLTAAEHEKGELAAQLADAKAEIAAMSEELGGLSMAAQDAELDANNARRKAAEAEAEKDAWMQYAAALEAYNALSWWKRRKAEKPVAPVVPVEQRGTADETK